MKTIIIWIAAILLVLVAGVVLYGLLNPRELETREYEINDDFKDIKIIADIADIELIPSEDAESRVVCKEQKSANHSVTVEENTLRIQADNNKKWYEHIGINLHTPKITVYLAKGEYENLSLKTVTGNVSLNNIVATGKVEVEVDTGSVLLNDVITTGKIEVETDTGNVNFEACDAGEVFIETDTGNVTGSFLSDKVVFAETDTGKVDVPRIIADEKCEITTDTGNIKITILN